MKKGIYKQLLEIAKTAVERAMETDEAIATIWINQPFPITTPLQTDTTTITKIKIS
ncbi:MAG: hypothetical protein RMY36_026465 [Nostoc sp. SerVER01]|nr:hypothetical protein [Nostoc sp. SerVER01]